MVLIRSYSLSHSSSWRWDRKRSLSCHRAVSDSSNWYVYANCVWLLSHALLRGACHSGFPWAVRCAGFVALLFSIVINLLLRPRLPPRKSGPIIEWAAFLEPAYVLFSIGMFLIFWALYFGFFYARSPLSSKGEFRNNGIHRSTPTPAR